MNRRRIILSNTDNTRDLGGYPIGTDKATRFGVFIRSAVPTDLREEDCLYLKNRGITTVIDFRTQEEVERTPSFFANREDFTYHHLSIRGSRRMREGKDKIPEAYMTMLNSDSMADIFKILAHTDGGCFYHCTAGKDRTGVVSALLLMLAGVDELDIIADYVITYPYLVRLLESLPLDDPDFPAYVIRSEPAYMKGFLHLFREKYRTAENYLMEIGLIEGEIEKLKNKLV